jgi:GDP-D-mannose dehydratase
MTYNTNLISFIQEIQLVEIYNLEAINHVTVSFETNHQSTGNVDALETFKNYIYYSISRNKKRLESIKHLLP